MGTPNNFPPHELLQMHAIDLITIGADPQCGMSLTGLVGPDDIDHRSAWMVCRHIRTIARQDGRHLVRIRLTRCPAPMKFACMLGDKSLCTQTVVRSWAVLLTVGWMRSHQAN